MMRVRVHYGYDNRFTVPSMSTVLEFDPEITTLGQIAEMIEKPLVIAGLSLIGTVVHYVELSGTDGPPPMVMWSLSHLISPVESAVSIQCQT